MKQYRKNKCELIESDFHISIKQSQAPHIVIMQQFLSQELVYWTMAKSDKLKFLGGDRLLIILLFSCKSINKS